MTVILSSQKCNKWIDTQPHCVLIEDSESTENEPGVRTEDSPDDGADVEDTVEAGDDGGPGPEREAEAAGVVWLEAWIQPGRV